MSLNQPKALLPVLQPLSFSGPSLGQRGDLLRPGIPSHPPGAPHGRVGAPDGGPDGSRGEA